MPTRTYLCEKCGEVCRMTPVYRLINGVFNQIQPTERRRLHCSQPMRSLSYEQGVASTHAQATQRVQWAALGLHIFRRGGKHQWIPAVTMRQAERAQDQYQGYLALKKEYAEKFVRERQRRLGIQPYQTGHAVARTKQSAAK